MLAIVRREERLAIAARTAIVHTQNHVTMVDEILRQRTVSNTRLTAWSTMHEDDRRDFVLRARLLRFVKNRWNLHAIERLVTNHGGVDEVSRINLRIQTVRELRRFLRREVVNIKIAGTAIAVQVERHQLLTRRDVDASDVRVWKLRQADELACRRVVNLDTRASVFINRRHAILSVA